jgi:dTMP kinase
MGLFIAIEGGDGSGKRTHAALLKEYLESKGKNVFAISFPRYDKPSARYVSRYLDGQYGESGSIHPDLSSTIYAIDRFAAKEDIKNALDDDSVVIADRYIASNLAHQGANPQLKTDDDRYRFYTEIQELEFDTLGVIKPNINIVLIMPTALAQSNVDKKDESAGRLYTDKKRDILEADALHLDKAKANFEELCQLYPDEFIAVQCADERGELRPIDEIQADIRQLVATHF